MRLPKGVYLDGRLKNALNCWIFIEFDAGVGSTNIFKSCSKIEKEAYTTPLYTWKLNSIINYSKSVYLRNNANIGKSQLIADGVLTGACL
jgi:hypothetical protein